jgi:hypothetical protein
MKYIAKNISKNFLAVIRINAEAIRLKPDETHIFEITEMDKLFYPEDIIEVKKYTENKTTQQKPKEKNEAKVESKEVEKENKPKAAKTDTKSTKTTRNSRTKTKTDNKTENKK